MPITALPADHGVGTFGSAARDFVDFLVEAGQTWWQILPLGQTGYGNSPYQPLSSFAGNPYLISLDDLVEEGYLEKEDLVEMEDVEDPGCVDYGMLYNKKMAVLKKAADHMPFVKPSDYDAFLTENGFWLKEYAIFMAIKEEHNGKAWQDWPEELKDHRSEQVQNLIAVLHENISRHERIQYFFFRQAKALKKYVEPLITRSKDDTTNSRRVVFRYLQNKYAVTELFQEISVKVGDRPGGYTRIIKTGFRRRDRDRRRAHVVLRRLRQKPKKQRLLWQQKRLRRQLPMQHRRLNRRKLKRPNKKNSLLLLIRASGRFDVPLAFLLGLT